MPWRDRFRLEVNLLQSADGIVVTLSERHQLAVDKGKSGKSPCCDEPDIGNLGVYPQIREPF